MNTMRAVAADEAVEEGRQRWPANPWRAEVGQWCHAAALGFPLPKQGEERLACGRWWRAEWRIASRQLVWRRVA